MTNVTTLPAVRRERRLAASPEEVYRAWLDPELLRRWMAPGSMGVTRVEVDERVGGRYRIHQHNSDGDEVGGFDCEIAEIVPNRRLVFRWGFVAGVRGPRYDSTLTVTFEPSADRDTLMTLVHEQLDELAAALPEGAAMVGIGWDLAIDKLAAVVEVGS